MEVLVIAIAGLIEAAVFSFLIFRKVAGGAGGGQEQIDTFRIQVEERKGFVAQIEAILGQMIDSSALKTKGQELMTAKESMKAERGRITITQAELETVENRLRELEEIERELEASGIETKEELKILEKKQRDLGQKNDTIKQQIAASTAQIDAMISQIEMNAQMQQNIDLMRAQLTQTEQQIDMLLLEIEQGNEQYFILKRRYDALDIEYAQLFEKFTESEAMIGKDKDK